MTTERSPGVPDELRGRLIQRLGSAKVLRTSAGEQVDAILAEIEAAGYVIVPESLMTSIKGIAVLMRMAFDCGAGVGDCEITDGQILDRLVATVEMLEGAVAGDLDAGEPGAGR